MMSRLIRWAREGSIATLTVVTLASMPTAVQAGWFDDVKAAAGTIFNSDSTLGKVALGTVMVGGVAIAAVGTAAIVGTAITGGAVLLVVAGGGLAIWGGYKLWKSFGKDDVVTRTPPATTNPTRPGAGGGDPGRPGRIDPGRETPGTGAGTPGTGTPGSPGNGTVGGGSSTTPGNNSRRLDPTIPITNLPSTPVRTPGAGMAGALNR